MNELYIRELKETNFSDTQEYFLATKEQIAENEIVKELIRKAQIKLYEEVYRAMK